MDELELIGRKNKLFNEDLKDKEIDLKQKVRKSRILVLGGAGSIGQSVTKILFHYGPKALHVVDISENNLVELVRDLRSTTGYITGDFRTFAIDIGSEEFNLLIENESPYDYILNLSALKHVRSEKDPYTLLRMIQVNILNVDKTVKQATRKGTDKYFCVSTDKAANPVNLMGCSKRIMEKFVLYRSNKITCSMSRFANVAFSDGSLLHSFKQRLLKKQPIVAPSDIRRYFVTSQEAGELCVLSCFFGSNREIFFPRLDAAVHMINFPDIVSRFLEQQGYEPFLCDNEQEAREMSKSNNSGKKWPCFFHESNTSGEKPVEEFYTNDEMVAFDRFNHIGVIQVPEENQISHIPTFKYKFELLKKKKDLNKLDIINMFKEIVPEFKHIETGNNLDNKM